MNYFEHQMQVKSVSVQKVKRASQDSILSQLNLKILGLLVALSFAMFGCSKKRVVSSLTSSFSSFDVDVASFEYTVALVDPATGEVSSAPADLTVQFLGVEGTCVVLEEKHLNLRPDLTTGKVTLIVGHPENRTFGDPGLSIKGVFFSISNIASSQSAGTFVPGGRYDASKFSSSCQNELPHMGHRILKATVSNDSLVYVLPDVVFTPDGQN